jgi:CBS domain-containing membrane protein
MTSQDIEACVPVDISDDDIYEAMKDISGYLDITPGDFKEVYLKAYRHAVLRLTRSVKVAEVMTKDVAAVFGDTPLKDVASIMAANNVSGVPVIDVDGKVIGVVSEKDLLSVMGGRSAKTFMEVIAQCLKGRSCLAVPVIEKVAGDIMSAPALTVREDTAVVEVAGLFTQRGINRVPVVDKNGRMVGIVSRGDIVRSSGFGGGA